MAQTKRGAGQFRMRFWRSALALLSLGCAWLLLGACADVTAPPPADIPPPTASPAPASTITPTIDWFPATATPTVLPTTMLTALAASPTTPPQLPSGPLILKDDFSKKTLWATLENESGNVAYGKNELTLAIAQPKASLSSFRDQLVLDNFLLEISVTPSLCQGADQFGILFRVASKQDYYRYLMTCSGQLRLERLRNAEASVVQDWTPVQGIASLPMETYRLGIWASGPDLRFYVNDVFQFGRREPTFPTGGLGVFARSMANTIVTVNFSDLQIYQIKTPTPTPP